MTEVVPPGAFPEAAKHEQALATAHLGGPKQAFDSRAKSLGAMRAAVNSHEDRLAAVEGQLKNLPFPLRVRL